jgi:aminopeptidase N|tara:strand:- start:235 stop:942 length:708 start_codon:yes stop_codon:yes gene_type:complete
MNKNNIDRQIIAIGGGGFGRDPKHTKIEQYILNQTNKEKPNILFLPTASAEDKSYIDNYYACFGSLSCKPNHISFFSRTPKLNGLFNKADIIYVGGGNTKSMLAVWREWKVDILLRRAYEKGIVMSGVSAGAICWFKQGITDSWASNLNTIDCLGFLDEMCCPHYIEESDRQPSVHQMLKDGKVMNGYCLDGGSAAHFVNEKLINAISFYTDRKAVFVEKKNSSIIEKQLPHIVL